MCLWVLAAVCAGGGGGGDFIGDEVWRAAACLKSAAPRCSDKHTYRHTYLVA